MHIPFGDPRSGHELCRRIRGEFGEMPGLVLTQAQAQRLWTLEPRACEQVLAALVEEDFLLNPVTGALGRAAIDNGCQQSPSRASLAM